jgi:hypothetical protein
MAHMKKLYVIHIEQTLLKLIIKFWNKK